MTRTFLYVDIPICSHRPQPGSKSSHWQRTTRLPQKKALSVAITYEDLHRKWPNESPQLLLPYTHRDPKAICDILISAYPLVNEAELIFVRPIL